MCGNIYPLPHILSQYIKNTFIITCLLYRTLFWSSFLLKLHYTHTYWKVDDKPIHQSHLDIEAVHHTFGLLAHTIHPHGTWTYHVHNFHGYHNCPHLLHPCNHELHHTPMTIVCSFLKTKLHCSTTCLFYATIHMNIIRRVKIWNWGTLMHGFCCTLKLIRWIQKMDTSNLWLARDCYYILKQMVKNYMKPWLRWQMFRQSSCNTRKSKVIKGIKLG